MFFSMEDSRISINDFSYFKQQGEEFSSRSVENLAIFQEMTKVAEKNPIFEIVAAVNSVRPNLGALEEPIEDITNYAAEIEKLNRKKDALIEEINKSKQLLEKKHTPEAQRLQEVEVVLMTINEKYSAVFGMDWELIKESSDDSYVKATYKSQSMVMILYREGKKVKNIQFDASSFSDTVNKKISTLWERSHEDFSFFFPRFVEIVENEN